MRRRWRTLIVLLLLITGAAVLALEYVNRVVLPVKVRGWAEQTLSQTLGRAVTIQRIRIHLWYGLLLEEVRIAEDARYGQKPFLEVEQISGQVLILPLLKQQQIVIPTIRVVHPSIQLIQDPNGLWNVQSLTLSRPSSHPGKNRFRLVVPRLTITDGQISLFLQKPSSPFKLHLEHLEAQAHFAFPAHVRWTVETGLANGSSEHIRMEGTYDLQQHLLSIENQWALSLKTFLPLLPEKIRSSISTADGLLSASFNLTRGREGPFAFQGSLRTQGLRWKTRLRAPLGRGPHAVNHLEGQGDLRMDLGGQFPPQNTSTPWAGWRGTLTLDRIIVGPLPWLGQLKELTGQLNITSEGIRTEQITATLPSGQPLSLSGSLLNDEQKTVLLLIKTDLPLQQMPPVPAPFQEWLKKTKPTGDVALETIIEGTLKPAPSLQTTLTGALHDVSFLCPGLGLLQQISGKVRWQPDLMTVTKLTGLYQDQPFQGEGSLVNFNQPEVDARVAWGRLSLDTRFSVDGKQVEIHTFSGQYGQGTFHAFGQVTLEEKPTGNLYGEGSVRLEELASLLPHPPPWLVSLPIKGDLSGRWILDGPLSKPQECTIGLKASSPRLLYQEIPLEQFSIDLKQESGRITVRSAKAILAEGTVLASGVWAYQQSPFPWKAALRTDAVELAVLAHDLHWKTQQLSGQMVLEWSGQGEGTALPLIQGNGTIHVGGGRIVELPLLGQFADLLGLPTLRTIVLQEAQGSFRIEQGAVRTEAFQIRAPQASLNIVGNGGFLQGADSPINWRIVPTLAPELVPEETRARIGRVIAKGTSYLMGEIQIKGTWKNPKRTFLSKPIVQILNEQIFNLQDLFKQLF